MKLLEILNMMNILASMVYTFLIKKTGSGARAASKVGVSANEKLTEELHKPVMKKSKRIRVYTRFKDDICAADSAEMGSLSSKNRNVKYSLFVIDVFTKYAWLNL